jgi:hypothetical protein
MEPNEKTSSLGENLAYPATLTAGVHDMGENAEVVAMDSHDPANQSIARDGRTPERISELIIDGNDYEVGWGTYEIDELHLLNGGTLWCLRPDRECTIAIHRLYKSNTGTAREEWEGDIRIERRLYLSKGDSKFIKTDGKRGDQGQSAECSLFKSNKRATNGHRGGDGLDGQNGGMALFHEPGATIDIFLNQIADGVTLTIISKGTSGGDGGDGGPGGDGGDGGRGGKGAKGFGQSVPGGDGGDGGNGGNGGNGADATDGTTGAIVTVHVQSPEDRAKIVRKRVYSIGAAGGKGGAGGKPGRGGDCDAGRSKGKPGTKGKPGADGKNGNPGQPGKIIIVDSEWPAENNNM